jgi:hypothetical protein
VAPGIPALGQSVSPPGPGPLLSNAKAISDLTAARVLTPRLAQAAAGPVSAQDFAQMLLRATGIAVPKSLAAAGAPGSAALAALAVTKLHFAAGTKSFATPAAPIVREDAVATAVNAAASKGLLRAGVRSKRDQPFADEASFSNPALSGLAHLAVDTGLARVGPDNRFNPRAPIAYGDAAYVLDAIRLGAVQPQEE